MRLINQSVYPTITSDSPMTFNMVNNQSNCFQYSNGTITIGENVNLIRLSYSISGQSPNGRLWLRAFRERNGSYELISNGISYGTYMTVSDSNVIDVQCGDKITLRAIEDLYLSNGGIPTFCTIEKIY